MQPDHASVGSQENVGWISLYVVPRGKLLLLLNLHATNIECAVKALRHISDCRSRLLAGGAVIRSKDEQRGQPGQLYLRVVVVGGDLLDRFNPERFFDAAN